MRDNAGADFVLGIPDVLYRDVVARSPYGPEPAAFRPVLIDVPDKDFVEHAWVYLPPLEHPDPPGTTG